jgi:hypothetical protein
VWAASQLAKNDLDSLAGCDLNKLALKFLVAIETGGRALDRLAMCRVETIELG